LTSKKMGGDSLDVSLSSSGRFKPKKCWCKLALEGRCPPGYHTLELDILYFSLTEFFGNT
jgi:hypothetical protein